MDTESVVLKSEYRDCRKCGFETFQELLICPKCATELHTESKIRNAGNLDVALGGLLVVILSGLLVGLTALFIYGKYYANTATRQNYSKPGTDLVIMAAYIFVLSLLSFAVTMIFAGRFAMKHGRRDRRKIKIAMSILFAGLAFMTIIRILLG